MSEVAAVTPPTELVAYGEPKNGTDLAAWVADFADAYTLADRLCRTPFAPQAFKGKPEDLSVAILHGKSLGLDPLASMSSIFVISGRPGLYAKSMHAIVLAAGHEVWVDSESMDEVVVMGRRKGSENITRSVWTVQRAEQAGYFSNAKYRTDPISMLKARAIGDVCRVVAPDVLVGLGYNEADVAIMEDLGEHQQPVRRGVAARLQSAATDDQPPTGESAPANENGPCSRDEANEVAAALKALGHDTKDAMLRIVSEWVGRPMESARDLTSGEARSLASEMREAAADMVIETGMEKVAPPADGPVVDDMGPEPTERTVDPEKAERDAAWIAGN